MGLQCWPMGRPWAAHGSAMGHPWISHGLTAPTPWVTHGFPMDLPWVYSACPRVTRGILKGHPWVTLLVSAGPWVVHGSPVGVAWFHLRSTGRPRVIHVGLRLVSIKLTHGSSMGIHGSPNSSVLAMTPMGRPWDSRGFPSVLAHGEPMCRLRVAHGSPVDRFHMGFAALVHGSAMCQPWISHKFTVLAHGSRMLARGSPLGRPWALRWFLQRTP